MPAALLVVACDQQSLERDDADFDDPRQSTFVPAPDFGGGTIVDCSLFSQNCPAGHKCMPYADDGGSAWNASRCSPVSPDPRAPGQPCLVEDSAVSGIDDCERGAMCWDVDAGTLEGTCVAMLLGSGRHPICANPIGVPSLSAGHELTICLPSCHPLHDDCERGRGCYPREDGFACMPDVSGDTGDFGDPCEFPNVCRSGLACVAGDIVPNCAGLGCCAPYCDLDAPACPQGTTCQPWADDPPPTPHPELVGICRV